MLLRESHHEKEGLHQLIAFINNQLKTDTKSTNIIEIGSYMGESSEIFADNFQSIICVDAWNADIVTDGASYGKHLEGAEQAFIQRMKWKNYKKFKMTSDYFFEQEGDILKTKNIKVIYIDGLHTYEQVKRDIQNAVKAGIPIISGHDFSEKNWPGVVKAVREILGEPLGVFCDSSWVVKINS